MVRRVPKAPIAHVVGRRYFRSSDSRPSSLGNAITTGIVAGVVGGGTIISAGQSDSVN